MFLSWVAMLKRKTSRGHVTPHRGGMLGKLSKIVILCYYVSIFYLINYDKNIQNIKNCS